MTRGKALARWVNVSLNRATQGRNKNWATTEQDETWMNTNKADFHGYEFALIGHLRVHPWAMALATAARL
jgi:hypothetical protein